MIYPDCVLLPRYGIEQIYLSGNPMGCDGIVHISDAVTVSDTLRLLELSNCNINDEGMILLQSALSANSSINSINISENPSKPNLVARAEVHLRYYVQIFL